MAQFAQRMIDVDGARLEVFLGGSGRPLICGTNQWTVQTAQGGPLAEVLVAEGTLVSVNARDAGNSSPAREPWELGMASLVDDLERIRQQLGGERWVYVGHSGGGFIGLLYALRYKQGLARLILSDTAANSRFLQDEHSFFHPSHPDAAAVNEAQRHLADASASAEVRRRSSAVFLGAMLYNKQHLPHILDLTARGWGTSAPRRMQALRDEYQSYDVVDRLGEISVPTLVMCGRHDPVVPITHSERIHAGVPNSELVVFEESGHFPMIEEPEKFRDRVHRFMSQRVVIHSAGPVQ
jgi:proline iminopeptidase